MPVTIDGKVQKYFNCPVGRISQDRAVQMWMSAYYDWKTFDTFPPGPEDPRLRMALRVIEIENNAMDREALTEK